MLLPYYWSFIRRRPSTSSFLSFVGFDHPLAFACHAFLSFRLFAPRLYFCITSFLRMSFPSQLLPTALSSLSPRIEFLVPIAFFLFSQLFQSLRRLFFLVVPRGCGFLWSVSPGRFSLEFAMVWFAFDALFARCRRFSSFLVLPTLSVFVFSFARSLFCGFRYSFNWLASLVCF